MRAALRRVHAWLGLAAGLVLLAVGLSGSALVYRDGIERWLARDLLAAPPAGPRVPLDAVVAAALAVEPGRRVARIHWPAGPDGVVEVVLQTAGARNLIEARLLSAYVDPADARVRGTRDRAAGPVWWLQRLHYTLFAGEPGLKANGAFALALLGLAVTGPVLWWPGWARRRDAWRVRPRPAAARWRDLHALAGVVACLVLAVTATTALWYAWREPAQALVETLAGGSSRLPPPGVVPAGPVPAEPLARLLAAARAARPDVRLDEFRPPRGPTAPASFAYSAPDDVVRGRHRLHLHPATGVVLRDDGRESAPSAVRIAQAMGPLHFGSFGGRGTQLAWFLGGLAPAFLMGTGAWLWWRRRAARGSGVAAGR